MLLGYRVSYVDSNTYAMKPICQPDTAAATEVDLLENVTFVASSFPPINFLVLQAGVENAQTITLTHDSLNYQVTIESKGVITGGML